ncbi:MAG TPA: serine hydroxymethyltransferase, partial [Polyangiaceae bacterium]|nr:serine hydroxymethyltransferase [Polyangiaceae bacterium]
TFRGPRGGIIMCKAEHQKAIDRAVFPGLQGGPHNHTTAGIAVAAKEALQPSFKVYAKQIIDNARALAEALKGKSFNIITGGTDNHLVLLDLTPKGVSGKIAAQALDKAGITANYNSIPFDPRKPFDPSGVRMGTAAVTSRGMGVDEMKKLAGFIDRVVSAPEDAGVIAKVESEVREVCNSFPAPGILQ